MTSKPLLTSLAACQILGIDRGTLTRWVAAGRVEAAQKLPGLTGAYLFEEDEIERERAEIQRIAEQAKAPVSP